MIPVNYRRQIAFIKAIEIVADVFLDFLRGWSAFVFEACPGHPDSKVFPIHELFLCDHSIFVGIELITSASCAGVFTPWTNQAPAATAFFAASSFSGVSTELTLKVFIC